MDTCFLRADITRHVLPPKPCCVADASILFSKSLGNDEGNAAGQRTRLEIFVDFIDGVRNRTWDCQPGSWVFLVPRSSLGPGQVPEDELLGECETCEAHDQNEASPHPTRVWRRTASSKTKWSTSMRAPTWIEWQGAKRSKSAFIGWQWKKIIRTFRGAN